MHFPTDHPRSLVSHFPKFLWLLGFIVVVSTWVLYQTIPSPIVASETNVLREKQSLILVSSTENTDVHAVTLKKSSQNEELTNKPRTSNSTEIASSTENALVLEKDNDVRGIPGFKDTLSKEQQVQTEHDEEETQQNQRKNQTEPPPQNPLYPYIFPITPCLHEEDANMFLKGAVLHGEVAIPIIETCNPDLVDKYLNSSAKPADYRKDLPLNSAPLLSFVIPSIPRVDGKTSYLHITLESLMKEIEDYSASIHRVYSSIGLESDTHGIPVSDNQHARRARTIVKANPVSIPHFKVMKGINLTQKDERIKKNVKKILTSPTVYGLDHLSLSKRIPFPKQKSYNNPISDSLRSPIPPFSIPHKHQFVAPFGIHIHVVIFSPEYPRLPKYVQELQKRYPKDLFPYLFFHSQPLEDGHYVDPGPLQKQKYEALPNDSSEKSWRKLLQTKVLQESDRNVQSFPALEVESSRFPRAILRRQTRHFARLFEMFVPLNRRTKKNKSKRQLLPFIRTRFGALMEDDFEACQGSLPRILAAIGTKLDNVGSKLTQNDDPSHIKDMDSLFSRHTSLKPISRPMGASKILPLSSRYRRSSAHSTFRRWTMFKAAVGGAGVFIHTSMAIIPRMTELQWKMRSQSTSEFAERMSPDSDERGIPSIQPVQPWVVFEKDVEEGVRDFVFPRVEMIHLDKSKDFLTVQFPQKVPFPPHNRHLSLLKTEYKGKPREEVMYMTILDPLGIATYLRIHQQRRPVDHLMEEYFTLDSPSTYFDHGGLSERFAFHSVRHMFTHRGSVSSLRDDDRSAYPGCLARMIQESRHVSTCFHDDVAPCLPRDTASKEYLSLFPWQPQ